MSVKIVGAGPMGREAKCYAEDCGLEDVSLLDVNDLSLNERDAVVCAIGDPERRSLIVEWMIGAHVAFVNVVHPTAYIGQRVILGEGCIIAPHVTLTCDIKIGKHVIINTNSSIGHDCEIGDYTYIGPGCHIGGRCKIPACCYLKAGTVLQPDTVFTDERS